ncbi:MAG: cupin domain-containing protein [Gammaproteobacteria bacterium]|nr:cupin domain-containing protein [Gammaproteobacteria bacterium]
MELQCWNTDRDGELSEAAMRRWLEAQGYRVCTYVYPPGTVFPDHSHTGDKMDGVISGRFRMTMDGNSIVLGPGDMLVVPRGVVHRAEVVGEAPVVSLDAIRIDILE